METKGRQQKHPSIIKYLYKKLNNQFNRLFIVTSKLIWCLMSSSLFKSILFGELRPWLDVNADSAVAGEWGRFSLFKNSGSVFPGDGEGYGGCLNMVCGVLKAHPVLVDRIRKEYPDLLPDDKENFQPFIRIRNVCPKNRRDLFYKQLMDVSARLFLKRTMITLSRISNDGDRVREFNATVEILVELVLAADKVWKEKSSEDVDFIMNGCRQHMMALILDLGLRFPELKDVYRYDDKNLYLKVLDQGCPEPSVFSLTLHYQEERFRLLLDRGADENDLAALWKDIIAVEPQEDAHHKAASLRMHIEDAAFLLIMDASFYDSEKLRDPDFCSKWIAGFRKEIMENKGPARIKDSVMLAGSGRIEALFPGIMRQNSHNQGGVSEGAGMLFIILKLSVNLLSGFQQKAHPDQHAGHQSKPESEGNGPEELIENFKDIYIHVKDAMQLMGIVDKTFYRYMRKDKVSVLELSNNNRFVLKKDLEAYFKKNTREMD